MNMEKPQSFDFGKTRYSVTSTKFEGELTFMYDEKGVLKWFSNDASMDDEQLAYLHHNFPTLDCLMIKLAGDSKTLLIKQTTQEITFDEFWTAYDFKMDRQDAEKAWNKMTPDQQKKAFENIPSYKYFLLMRRNQATLYPATYLRGKYDSNYKELAKQLSAA